jgi:hypothetical protein
VGPLTAFVFLAFSSFNALVLVLVVVAGAATPPLIPLTLPASADGAAARKRAQANTCNSVTFIVK